jgi:hypothetical protein
MHLIERYRGALLGLATGDALGTTLEFARPVRKGTGHLLARKRWILRETDFLFG